MSENGRAYNATETNMEEINMRELLDKLDDNDKKIDESAKQFGQMSVQQLEQWLAKNDTDEPGISPVFGQQIKAAHAALRKKKASVNEVSDEELDRQGLEQEEEAPILHDKAIDMLDDMLDALESEEDRYGGKGDVIRYALTRLQQVGVGR